MANLAKQSSPNPRDAAKRGPHGEPPPTRIVVVRDDAARLPKNVRPVDDASRFGVRTGFWTSIAVGSVVFLWLSGHVGETLGFARVVGAPELVSSNDQGFVTGVRMALAAPLRIFEMALADPMRLAAAFVLVSLPAAGLSVARPRVVGGPAPSKLATTFAWLAIIAAYLVWTLVVTWIALPARRAGLASMPFDRTTFSSWSTELAATAGFDAFAFISSVLWLVLMFRLPLPRVTVTFAAVTGFVATFVTWTGFAVSNGIADALKSEHPVVTALATETPAQSLLIGSIQGRVAVLTASDPPAVMAISAPEFIVGDRRSVEDWMKPAK
ncbi:MAG: hypothetical protein U0572_07735 [Phycisphaerales bacterium]